MSLAQYAGTCSCARLGQLFFAFMRPQKRAEMALGNAMSCRRMKKEGPEANPAKEVMEQTSRGAVGGPGLSTWYVGAEYA